MALGNFLTGTYSALRLIKSQRNFWKRRSAPLPKISLYYSKPQ